MSELTVVLTHQLASNLPYLKLALEGLSGSLGIDFHTILVTGYENPKLDKYDLRLKSYEVISDSKLDTATKKIEKAFKKLPIDTTHILLLSDDVIVSRTCLFKMFHAFKGRDLIMNPMSNSDCLSLYEIQEKSFKWRPDSDIKDFEDIEPILKYRGPFDVLIQFQSVSFYCTMITKKIFEKIGSLDSALEYRHNDQDFCFRAGNMGIRTVVNFGAFAFHFGSKTLNQYPMSLRDEATGHFLRKWKIQ